MSSISQIIPNYATGGISDQPDELKKPGQLRDCLNAYPDLVNGLYKRPGFKLLSSLYDECNGNIPQPQNGTWFPFIRQNTTTKTQENYLFYINQAGSFHAYDMDGNNVDVFYSQEPLTAKQINEGNIDFSQLLTCERYNYFSHEDNNGLKAVTVNNFTVVTNPENVVTTSTSDNKRPFEAFIEITQLAYNREYLLGLDFLNNTAPNAEYTVATKVNLIDVVNTRKDVNKNPSCPGTYHQIIDFDDTYEFRGGRRGQQGMRIDINTTGVQVQGKGKNLKCTYRTNLDLISGGTGWRVGDQVLVSQSGDKGKPRPTGDDIYYIIEVTEVKTVYTPNQYAITGVQTPSSGSTVVTINDVLNDLKTQLIATPLLSAKIDIVGNGLYIHHDEPFTISTSEKDLMNVLSNTDEEKDNPYVVVNNVSRLPIECKDGLVVKVANAFSDDDDYFVRFVSNYGEVGSSNIVAATGYWEEVAEPGTETILNSAHMPHVIIFATNNGVPCFVASSVDYSDRTCGTDDFNPSFVNKAISNVHFYRNRLVFLSEENVVMSRAGDLFNMFPASALGVAASDPIDLSVSTNFSSVLQDAIVINSGMVLFSKYQQFRLDTSNDILSPSTAKISEISRYEFDTETRPFALGTNIGFMGLSTTHSTFYELTNVFDQGPVDVLERSKIISRTIPNGLNLIADSKEANVVFVGKFDSDIVYGYRYFSEGNQNSIQTCWFRWQLPGSLAQHFVIDGDYYCVVEDDDGFSKFIKLQLDALPTAGPFYDYWQDNPVNTASTQKSYKFKLDFPIINVLKAEQSQFRSDTTASLVVHRCNFNFADIGSYEFLISRDGMDDYKVLYESKYMDEYTADEDPLVTEVERTVPVYTRNTNLNMSLESEFPHPLVLRSMRWEGDYNQRYYKRV